jgi:hypothetical protein
MPEPRRLIRTRGRGPAEPLPRQVYPPLGGELVEGRHSASRRQGLRGSEYREDARRGEGSRVASDDPGSSGDSGESLHDRMLHPASEFLRDPAAPSCSQRAAKSPPGDLSRGTLGSTEVSHGHGLGCCLPSWLRRGPAAEPARVQPGLDDFHRPRGAVRRRGNARCPSRSAARGGRSVSPVSAGRCRRLRDALGGRCGSRRGGAQRGRKRSDTRASRPRRAAAKSAPAPAPPGPARIGRSHRESPWRMSR